MVVTYSQLLSAYVIFRQSFCCGSLRSIGSGESIDVDNGEEGNRKIKKENW